MTNRKVYPQCPPNIGFCLRTAILFFFRGMKSKMFWNQYVFAEAKAVFMLNSQVFKRFVNAWPFKFRQMIWRFWAYRPQSHTYVCIITYLCMALGPIGPKSPNHWAKFERPRVCSYMYLFLRFPNIPIPDIIYRLLRIFIIAMKHRSVHKWVLCFSSEIFLRCTVPHCSVMEVF